MPMMVDYPEAYRGQTGLDFVVRAPTVWDETRVLAAEVGRLLAIARRSGEAWYIGAMTDSLAREVALPLAFLGPGDHDMELYSDPSDPSAPATEVIEGHFSVDAATVVRARLSPAGGCALRIAPASKGDPRLPRYLPRE